jgi:uncharacterized membrane protein
MSLIPSWAPGIHPLIVHFPLAILPLGIFVDAVSLILKKHTWLRDTALGLYALGAVGAIIAVISGEQGASGVLVTAAAGDVLERHEQWATLTMWFFILYTLGQAAIAHWADVRRNVYRTALLGVSVFGLFLLIETGEHGAELVFNHGVGVQVTDTSDATAHDHDAHGESTDVNTDVQTDTDDGHDHQH